MAEALKEAFDSAFVRKLGNAIRKAYPKFPVRKFEAASLDSDWEARELKARMRHISQQLHPFLPNSWNKSLDILDKVAPEFQSLAGMVFPDYVEVHGLEEVNRSLKSLELYTQYTTSEFAIRPFIVQGEKKVMKQMYAWSKAKNHHIRRLSSEGCRPRLPWAMALPSFKKDPSPILPILERLIEDDSPYVRRSVANSMNDISKDNPSIVITYLHKYLGISAHTDWILKHGSRTLLKEGNQEVMDLFGFASPTSISVTRFRIEKKRISIGDANQFHFSVENNSTKDLQLRLEYGVDYVKSNGKTGRKIFKISEIVLPAKKKVEYSRQHKFADLSTRKHYPGKHRITLILNGHPFEGGTFTLQ